MELKYRLDIYEVLEGILLTNPFVRKGKMFGYPAFYIVKKLLACLYKDGVALKISKELGKQSIDSGRADPFMPYGKKMGPSWILINHESIREYQNDIDLFENAIQYMLDNAK